MPKKKPPTRQGNSARIAQPIPEESLTEEQIESIWKKLNHDKFQNKHKFSSSLVSNHKKYLRLESTSISGNSTPQQKRDYLEHLTQITAQLRSELEKLDPETTYMLKKEHVSINERAFSPTQIIDSLSLLEITARQARKKLSGTRPQKRSELRLLAQALHQAITECAPKASLYSYDGSEYKGDLVDLVTATLPYTIKDAASITNNAVGEAVKFATKEG